MMRHLCKGRSEPILELCRKFNSETHDGRKMDRYSRFLEMAIRSIIQTKTEKEIESFFTAREDKKQNCPAGSQNAQVGAFQYSTITVGRYKSIKETIAI